MLLIKFRILYPEFIEAPDDFIQAHLDEQEEYLDAEVLGSHLDEIHGLRAAHAMALSPHGKAARLSSKEGESTYGIRLDHLEKILGHGFRVL